MDLPKSQVRGLPFGRVLGKAEVFELDGGNSVLEGDLEEEHRISLDDVGMQAVDFLPEVKERSRKAVCSS